MGENSGLCGFRNDEKLFPYEKSTFNLRNKDTIIETYLSCLEERLLGIDISSERFNNLTQKERNALYILRNDPTIIIKGADMGSAVVVWDREDYLKEAYKQLEDRYVYEKVQSDCSIIIDTIMRALGKIRMHLITSWSKILNLLGFTFNQRFTNVCIIYLADPLFQIGFYAENISSFLNHHLQPIAQKVNSFIRDTNHFLRKIKSLGQLLEVAILCAIDVVDFYPNISHKEELASLRRFLDKRTEKKVTTETLQQLQKLL